MFSCCFAHYYPHNLLNKPSVSLVMSPTVSLAIVFYCFKPLPWQWCFLLNLLLPSFDSFRSSPSIFSDTSLLLHLFYSPHPTGIPHRSPVHQFMTYVPSSHLPLFQQSPPSIRSCYFFYFFLATVYHFSSQSVVITPCVLPVFPPFLE